MGAHVPAHVRHTSAHVRHTSAHVWPRRPLSRPLSPSLNPTCTVSSRPRVYVCVCPVLPLSCPIPFFPATIRHVPSCFAPPCSASVPTRPVWSRPVPSRHASSPLASSCPPRFAPPPLTPPRFALSPPTPPRLPRAARAPVPGCVLAWLRACGYTRARLSIFLTVDGENVAPPRRHLSLAGWRG